MNARRRSVVRGLCLVVLAVVAMACSAQGALATDLNISQTDAPDPVLAGQSVTYTILVGNDAGPVAGVTVTDTLPTGSVFQSATPSVGICPAPIGATLTCSLGELAGLASASIDVVVTSPATSTTMTNAVTVEPTDATPADNSSSEQTVVAGHLSIDDVSIVEGDAGTVSAVFTVTRVGTGAASAAFATSNGTATQPGDYAPAMGIVTFADVETTKTIAVTVVGDTKNELDETFNVTLSSPSVGTTITKDVGIGTILNDDLVPTLSIGDVAVTEGNAGTTTATFTVTLSAASGRQVTVAFASLDGTATSPSDFAAASGTLTFTEGQTSKTVLVLVQGDTVVEPDETFNVTLSPPVSATLADGLGVGTITNDDLPSLAIGDRSVVEGNAGTVNAVFTVTRSSPVGISSATFTTSNGTATAPSDYVAASGTVSFVDGDLTKTIAVIVNGDTVVEPDETFNVTLSAPVNATLGDAAGVGTIVNDDLPSISIGDRSVVEGNAGTVDAVFTLTRSSAVGESTVNFATSNGTATAGSDYVAAPPGGSVSFVAGETTKTIPIVVIGDTVVEPDETFNVTLSAPVNATLLDFLGVGTITNDDVPSISISDFTVPEGDVGPVNAMFTLTRSPALGASTVNFTTSNGTATAPGDYVAASGTVSFAPGDPTKTITVIVNGDTLGELDETFNVTLTAPVNATLADGLGIGTIRNDDPPSLAISDVSVAEGNAGTVGAVFTVTRTITTGATSVSFATSNGTATAGSDYVAASGGSVSFAAGEATKTITIVVNGDTVVEPDETFNVTLTAPTNANFVDALGVGTIANDDFLFVSIGDVSVVEGNAGTVNAVFTVTRSFAVGTSTVRFATGGGTAAAGIDYVAATGTVSFGVGETSKTVTVAVTGDTAVEPDETFEVTLSTATGTTIADGLGVGTITNDDVTPPVVQGKRALVLTTTADKARSKTESKNGYTITITNPNAGAVTVTKVVVCLPQRFLYRSRSTTKAITANPSRTRCGLAGKARPAPQKLTWNVSLVVPARGSVSFHFAINVGSKVGTFKNAVTGVAADGYIVTATGPTAPVKVVKPPKLREVVRR